MIPSSQNALADSLRSSPFIIPSERTVIDKLFAREDIDRIKDLQKKRDLTKEEWQELLHLMTAVEPKLLNLEPELMYKFSKFIIAVASFITLSASYSDAKEKLDLRKQSGGLISDRALSLFNEARARTDKSTKLLLSVFLYSGRVTLSNKAMAFKEFIRAQWELEYAKGNSQTIIPNRTYLEQNRVS